MFVTDAAEGKTAIDSLPGQHRWSVNSLDELIEPLYNAGLRSVLLFGALDDASRKDGAGSCADDVHGAVIQATQYLKRTYPDLYVAVDVCLCAYTDHGHCGMVTQHGDIDNMNSVTRLTEVASAYVDAGCDMLAPSDMMEGRIAAMKTMLQSKQLAHTVPIMAYSAKFSSCMYGPFRDAAGSSVDGVKSDRSTYQLPPDSTQLALRALERDAFEGADVLMIKPGLPYLDIIKQASTNYPATPLATYQVSGEYAMLAHAAAHGAVDLREGVYETFTAFNRSGAQVICTYFTKQAILDDWSL
jgi:porphobilinogen synthase